MSVIELYKMSFINQVIATTKKIISHSIELKYIPTFRNYFRRVRVVAAPRCIYKKFDVGEIWENLSRKIRDLVKIGLNYREIYVKI